MDDEKLIECVRNCPCLYDKSHTDFKDREKKRRAWMEVANNLEVDQSIAMKRWGNLRERFSKEIRCCRNTSGSAGRQWALLESMHFLRDHIIPRPMRQSAPLIESSFESGISCETLLTFDESLSPGPIPSTQLTPISTGQSNPIPPAETPPSIYRTRKRKAAHIDEIDSTIMEAIKTFQEVCARRSRREELSAEITGFGTMICSAISKMKKINQALVMCRCTEIVMAAQIDEHQEVREN